MWLFSPSDVYQETWLLLCVTRLLGLYPIKCCKIASTGYIYVILLLVLYFVAFFNLNVYAAKVFEVLDVLTPATKIRKIRHYMNLVLLPMMIISSFYQSSKIQAVYEEIDNVDKSFKFLNSKIDHEWCMKNDIVRIVTVIFAVMLFNLMDYYAQLDESRDYMYVLMWIFDRTPDFVNTISMCSFYVLIHKIGVRFKETNRIMNSTLKNKYTIAMSEPPDSNTDFRLQLLKLLHLKLCKAVALLDNAYGFQFAILTMLYIAYACLHLILIYTKSYSPTDTVDVALSTLWGTFDIVKLTYIIHLYRILTIQHV